MENNNSGFKWRWVASIILFFCMIAALTAVGAMAYNLGHEHGYNELEKEIVYAIALNRSNHVGNFLVAKLNDGATLIALKENDFSVEVEK